MLHEFEVEKVDIQKQNSVLLLRACSELTSLKHQYEIQNKEMNHVRQLAKCVLKERCDVEQFFLEALSEVRKEIVTNR